MNGPPGHGKAVEALPAPSTAHREAESTDSIGDETDERKRFADLQDRAARLGHSLRRASGGYVLCRWSYSRHAIDLDTIGTLIVRMERGR